MAKSVRGEILHLEREQVRAINRDKAGGWEEKRDSSHSQADAFAGARAADKIGLLRSE